MRVPVVRVLFPLLAAFSLAAQQPAPAPPKTIGGVTLFGEEQPRVEAATKPEIPISKAPTSVTVITAKQIGESRARTVPDLLPLPAGGPSRRGPPAAARRHAPLAAQP